MFKGPSGNTEQLSFYRKMAELQDKLKRSEEERARLERQFTELVQGGKAVRNDERLSNLRHEYGNILDRERRRKARNEKIMSGLENIERHTCVINAKTEHLKLMRRQFDSYMLKKYPDEFKINKRTEQQSAPYEAPQTSYRTAREPAMQWKTQFYNSQQQQPGYNFPPQQRDPFHAYGRPNESIFAKPASTPLNPLRHDQPHPEDMDRGSPMWSSMNDIKPLNLTMDDRGFPQSGMRNIEDNLSKLILEPADSYQTAPKSTDLKDNEERMMEELTKITKNLEVMKKDSFDAEDDAPQRCQSSMGMIEKSLNLHEETKKLLEETSPRKSEELLESIGESQDEDLSIPVVPEDFNIPVLPEDLSIPVLPEDLSIPVLPEDLSIPVLPEDLSIPVLPEEEEDILYAESTVPEQSEVSEVVTQDVTEPSHGQLDFVQNLPVEPQTPQFEMVSDANAEFAPTEIIPQDDANQVYEIDANQSEHSSAVIEQEEQLQMPAPQEEFAPEEPYAVQEEGQLIDQAEAIQPGANMYGNDESSESTVPSGELLPVQESEAQQAVDGAGFREMELQQNPSDNLEEVETLAEYDSSEMTSASQQPEQEAIKPLDDQSITTSDEVEQQIADIMKHAPTSALPPAPPGKTAVSPSSSWGKLKNIGATGALRNKPVSPTSSRAGSAKSSPGSKKSPSPPSKSPTNKSPSSSSGTKSPVAKKPSPAKK